jgi:ketosteroid isomerase-like protein
MAANIQTVQKIYEAFGKGDIPGILGGLADDVQWEWGGVDHGIPWLKPRKGKGEVGKFFEALNEHINLTRFEPFTFAANDEYVLVLCRVDATHKKTGKKFSEAHEGHVWGFNKAGKINRFAHLADTLAHKNVL